MPIIKCYSLSILQFLKNQSRSIMVSNEGKCLVKVDIYMNKVAEPHKITSNEKQQFVFSMQKGDDEK